MLTKEHINAVDTAKSLQSSKVANLSYLHITLQHSALSFFLRQSSCLHLLAYWEIAPSISIEGTAIQQDLHTRPAPRDSCRVMDIASTTPSTWPAWSRDRASFCCTVHCLYLSVEWRLHIFCIHHVMVVWSSLTVVKPLLLPRGCVLLCCHCLILFCKRSLNSSLERGKGNGWRFFISYH